MAIESASDRQAYVETFGVPAVVGGVSLNGVFDNAFLETLETSASEPMLMIVTTDAPLVTYGSVVTVASASFSGTVNQIQPDGTGITILVLGES